MAMCVKIRFDFGPIVRVFSYMLNRPLNCVLYFLSKRELAECNVSNTRLYNVYLKFIIILVQKILYK
jgi:hypothetical protein